MANPKPVCVGCTNQRSANSHLINMPCTRTWMLNKKNGRPLYPCTFEARKPVDETGRFIEKTVTNNSQCRVSLIV